jgi:hypothetical protein
MPRHESWPMVDSSDADRIAFTIVYHSDRPFQAALTKVLPD